MSVNFTDAKQSVQCIEWNTIMQKRTLRGVDLHMLVVLRTLLETHSTVATARKLNMSQPAVSRSLGRLRQLFDDKLTVKTAQGLLPTERALTLVQPLAEVLKALDVLLDSPSFSPATTSRTFRIAMSHYGISVVLSKLLSALATDAPNAKVDILTFSEEAFRHLETGAIDLALLYAKRVPSKFHRQSLIEDEFVAAVRKGHPLAKSIRGGKLPLKQYISQRHVQLEGGNKYQIDTYLEAEGHSRDIAVRVPNLEAAIQLTEASDIVLTYPRRGLVENERGSDLVIFSLPLKSNDFEYQMIWHDRTASDPAAIWLRERLAEICAR